MVVVKAGGIELPSSEAPSSSWGVVVDLESARVRPVVVGMGVRRRVPGGVPRQVLLPGGGRGPSSVGGVGGASSSSVSAEAHVVAVVHLVGGGEVVAGHVCVGRGYHVTDTGWGVTR